jgi:AraC-like DNA-binding protein
MVVKEFNTRKGLYLFELQNIETELHSHPVVEIIWASEGVFTLSTPFESFTQLRFAVISANQIHKITASNAQLSILMVENHATRLVHFFKLANMELNSGYFTDKSPMGYEKLLHDLRHSIPEEASLEEYDPRVSKTIAFLRQHPLSYEEMMKTLGNLTHLSESRLSHLFKLNVGVSLKRYLIWSKLKLSIQHFLDSKEDLFTASITSGFYDQPHFSKSFKSMFGVKPSQPYPSRILQVLPKSTP